MSLRLEITIETNHFTMIGIAEFGLWGHAMLRQAQHRWHVPTSYGCIFPLVIASEARRGIPLIIFASPPPTQGRAMMVLSFLYLHFGGKYVG